MTTRVDIEKLDEKIRQLKQAALELNEMGNEFPAVKRNTARVLASIRMMEINVCDVAGLAVD
ncbi:MAG: hypothetical protein P4L55_18785 [Syntrophobacteraceae bacterium]|nr:hypothetical protein [Syntrophobacteraceae bacterium]